MTRPSLSAIARLLDRQAPDGYTAEWTDIIGEKAEEAEAHTVSVVVFRVRMEWLSLPTTAFQEVTKLGRIHRLPHTRNSALLGLVNVRGELLLCAALDILLGLEAAQPDSGPGPFLADQRLLVCDFRHERLAFPVCEVAGTWMYSPTEVRSVPATLSKSATCVRGVVRWNHKTVGCLDPELLFKSSNEVFE